MLSRCYISRMVPKCYVFQVCPGTWQAWSKIKVFSSKQQIYMIKLWQHFAFLCYCGIVKLLLKSCNPSLHIVEKFQICLPEHEAAVHNERSAAVPSENAHVYCIILGLPCLHFAEIPLETCFQSSAVRVQLIFPRALKSVCLGRLSLKPVHSTGSSGRIWTL